MSVLADRQPLPTASATGPSQVGPFRDLAPMIHRQRMVIEGYPSVAPDDADIRGYLSDLSTVLDMTLLLEPVTHRSDLYGWAGWVHWETSGAHFYAWETPVLFFSVDIYTCKAFDPVDALDYTRRRLGATELVFREF